jgi:predicted acyltransferase
MATITAEPQKKDKTSETTSARFLSLDIFRGMTIAGMILVNTPGSWSYVYSPLRHAPWNGCTPTDLVFPFFLFAVGNAMSFSMGKYQALGNAVALRKIFMRAALIFAIGLFLNWFPFIRWDEGSIVAKSFDNLRIFGVLQRIALAYLGGALIAHFYKPTQAFFIAGFLLIAYWAILLMYGDLTLEGNAVLALDQWLIGEDHMYKGYFSSIQNANIAFDPEGLLSTIPAISSVVFGFLVGRFIQLKGNSFEMASNLFVVGLISIFLGLWWGIVFPINKPIWSSSYVLYTTGLAMCILGIIVFLVDLQNYKKWSNAFVLYGKNPLLIYALSGIIVKIYFLIRLGDNNAYGWLYTNVFQPIGGDYFGSFLFALAHVLLFLGVAAWLDKKRIYFKV